MTDIEFRRMLCVLMSAAWFVIAVFRGVSTGDVWVPGVVMSQVWLAAMVVTGGRGS